MRILIRTCRRLLLGRRARAEVAAGDDIAAQPVPVELRRDLVKALAELPSAYREVLILRDVEEWTAPEVATELGVSIEAVKSRLHRARQMMRERLDASAYWK
jgi:RNA polymerase sigma factor (sigma-70 family)